MGRKSKLVWNWISEGQMWPLPGYQAFWLPPSLPVPCSILYRKRGGGKIGRVGGRKRREEVGGGSVFESEAYAVKLCTTPCGAGCVEREIIFPAEKHSPMWTWHPHPLVGTFSPSFAHLDLSLLSFTFTMSLSFSFILFYSTFCPVMLEYHLLTLSDRLTKTGPYCSYCP